MRVQRGILDLGPVSRVLHLTLDRIVKRFIVTMLAFASLGTNVRRAQDSLVVQPGVDTLRVAPQRDPALCRVVMRGSFVPRTR